MALIHEGWDHLGAAAARGPVELAAGHAAGGTVAAAAQAIATLESAADLPAAARASTGCAGRPTPRAEGPGTIGCGASAGGGAGSGAEGRVGEADLAAMADAFGRLAAEGRPDAAAWYNRAICLAWLGSNREAVACLDARRSSWRPSRRRPRGGGLDAGRALRQGGGAEELADDLRFACTIDWDPGETARCSASSPRSPGADAAGAGRRALPTLRSRVFEWPDRMIPGADQAGPNLHRDGRRVAGRPGERDRRPVVADAAALQPAGRDAPAGRGATALPVGAEPAPASGRSGPARGVAAAAAVPRRRRLDGPHARADWSRPGPRNAARIGSSIIMRTSGFTGAARGSAGSRRWPPRRRRIGGMR